MTSQEAKGSFMQVQDVINYFKSDEEELEPFANDIVEIDGIPYLPTSLISTWIDAQDWRVMQSVVTSTMFFDKSEII